MLALTISSLKNQLSAVIKRVRRGDEVLVLDRNEPVAKLVSVSASGTVHADEDLLLIDLERKGIVTLPQKPLPSRQWLKNRLVKTHGKKSGVELLLKEREESR